jgi:hypothetical protein
METKQLTAKERRQRQFFLVLPAIALPFTTLFFIALGGGACKAAGAGILSGKGLNTQLPNAKLKDDRGLNKMSYYDKAASDSAKIRQQLRTDPYYRNVNRDSLHSPANGQILWNPIIGKKMPGGQANQDNPDNKVKEAYRKLTQLQAALSKPSPVKPLDMPATGGITTVDKVSAITQHNTEDPELTQMSGLLEKILDIQHPDRVMQKTNAQASPIENKRFQAIPAVIDGKQKITEGTVVRMRLLDTVTINGQLIPRRQLLFGSGQLYNQRLTMNIKLIRIGNNIIPVDLTVYDMTDGLEGICVPEAITGDAVRDGAANGVQGLELMSLDPSVGTQLAGAGINAAKGLFSKKVKRIKAKLQDGHRLLLRDNKKIRDLQK